MQSELKDQQIVQTLKETFNMGFIQEMNEQYLKNFSSIMHETNDSFTKLTIHMQEASVELKSTLENMSTKKEGLDTVKLMQDNIEGFNKNAQSLQKSMERFDASVDHTFDKIDRELGKSVEKLTTFARIVSEQNQLILKNMAILKEQEKREK